MVSDTSLLQMAVPSNSMLPYSKVQVAICDKANDKTRA